MAITGDLISGQMYDQSEENSFFWEHYFVEFFHIMNSYDIPWGFVPGFHDYETGWNNEAMERVIKLSELHTEVENKFQYLGHDIAHGFNFHVPIEKQDSNEEVGRIWFFGTGRSECIGQIGRDCLRRD